MSFILRSSKFACSFFRCHRQAYLLRVQSEISHLKKKNRLVNNAILAKEFSTPAPKPNQIQRVNQFLNRLDSNLNVQQKISVSDVEELLVALKLYGSVGDSQSLLLLRLCSNLNPVEKPEEKIRIINEVWFTLEKLGVKFTTKHFNALLKAYVEYEHKFSPEKFLHNLKEVGILPDMFMYQRLLKAYCQQGDIQGASNLLEKMKNEDFPINEDIFNSLVYGHCQINDLESALGIIVLMKNKGINPSSETYLHLMCFHAKKGQMDEIEKILNENENEIIFSDKDLLNILYVLAKNGHTECIDEILKRVKKNVGYNMHATNVIHRLLHDKLDFAAIKVFATLKEAMFHFRENFVIEHVVKTRSCMEIVEFCEKLENADLVSGAIYDGLKETLRFRDTSTILEFVEIMKGKNVELQSHYTWPLIIKASKRGNDNLIKVWQKMLKMRLPYCSITFSKVFLPNYKFNSNWSMDIDKLKSIFIPEKYIFNHIFGMLLEEGKMKDAEKLATSRPLFPVPKQFVRSMVDCLKATKEVDSFIEILYSLFHDFTLQKSQTANEDSVQELPSDSVVEEESSATHDFKKYLHSIFEELLDDWYDKDILLSLLKGMLDKNIGIESRTGNFVCRKCNDPEIEDIVQHLTSSNVQPQVNENIISHKNRPGLNKELAKALHDDDLEKALTIWRERNDELCHGDHLSIVKSCLKMNNIEKTMEIYEEICRKSENKYSKQEKRSLFKVVVRELTQIGDIVNVKKAFEIGYEYKYVTAGDMEVMIKILLERDELGKATDIFCEEIQKYNNLYGYSSLITKLIKAQDTERIEKLTNAVTQLRGEAHSLTMLLFHFAATGHVKQVQKLLDTQNFSLSLKRLRKECQFYFEIRSTTFFETLLAATKSFPGSYRKILFQYLYLMYILSDHIEKAKNLWMQIEAEDDSQYLPLVQEIERFFQNQERFDRRSIQTKQHVENITKLIHELEVSQNFFGNEFFRTASEKTRIQEVVNEAISFILDGKVENFITLLDTHKVSRYLCEEICHYFVTKEKMDAYLSFWDKTLTESKFVPFIWSDEVINSFVRNENFLSEFKNFAYGCIEKGFRKPMQILWECYMFLPEYEKEAEEIYQTYLLNMKPCSFQRLLHLSRRLNNFSALKLVTKSSLFQSISILHPEKCYSELIKKYTTQNDLDTAMSYLEKAVSANYGDSINKSVLTQLANSFTNSGREFPYKHLLREEEEKEKKDEEK